MERGGVYGQDVVVSLCCSFHLALLLCSVMGLPWAALPSRVEGGLF